MKQAFCPNLSNPEVRKEFNDIVSKLDPNPEGGSPSQTAIAQAHYLWDKYKGNVPIQVISSEVNKNIGLNKTDLYLGERGKQEFKDDMDTLKTVFVNLLNDYTNSESRTPEQIQKFSKKLIGDRNELGLVPKWFLMRTVSVNGEMLSDSLFEQYEAIRRTENDDAIDAFMEANNIDPDPPRSYAEILTEEQKDVIVKKFDSFYLMWREKNISDVSTIAGYQYELIRRLDTLGFKISYRIDQIERDTGIEFGVSEESNLGTYDKIYALKSFEQSATKNKKGTYSRLLSRVLTREKNYLQMQTYQDPTVIYKKLTPILQRAKTKEEALDKIRSKVKAVKELTNLPDVIENFTPTELAQFLGLFQLHKQEYRTVLQEFLQNKRNIKEVKYVNPEAKNVAKQSVQEYNNLIIKTEGDTVSDTLYSRTLDGKLKLTPRKFNPEAYKDVTVDQDMGDGVIIEAEVIPEDFVERVDALVQSYRQAFEDKDKDWREIVYLSGRILFELGIDLSKVGNANESALTLVYAVEDNGEIRPKDYVKFTNTYFMEITKKGGILDDIFETRSDQSKITRVTKLKSKAVSQTFISKYNSKFRSLFDLTLQNVVETPESFVNARNNSTYPWQLPSFLDDFLKQTKQSGDAKSEAFLEMFGNLISVGSKDNPQYRSYLWEQILSGIGHFEISDVVNTDGEAKAVSDLTERERLIFHMDAYIGDSNNNSFFNVIADGDRSRVPFLKLKRIYLERNIKLSDTSNVEEPIDVIRNIIIRDLRRIAIENANPNARQVLPRFDDESRFSLSGMVDTEIKGAKLSSVIEKLIENEEDTRTSISYEEHWKEIDRLAFNWMNTILPEMVEQYKQDLIKYKIINVVQTPVDLGKVALTTEERKALTSSTTEDEIDIKLDLKQLRPLENKRYIEIDENYFEIVDIDAATGVTTFQKVAKEDVEFMDEVRNTSFTSFQSITEGTSVERLNQLLTGYIFDKAVYKVEFVDMFSGGKSRFKSNSEIYKRWSLFSTPGIPPVIKTSDEEIGMPETYNEASIDNLRLLQEYHNYLADKELEVLITEREKLLLPGQELTEEDLAELKDIADAKRSKIADIADAIAFITPEFGIQLRQGYYHQWSEEDKAAYDLYKQTGKYPFGVLPHKFIYINTRNTSNQGESKSGDIQQVFDADKNSYFEITDEMAAKSDVFATIRDGMLKNNIQVLNVRSGKKGIKDNIYPLQNLETGTLNTLDEITPLVQRSDKLIMVQRISDKPKTRAVFGKQLRNNQLTNILDSDIIVLNPNLPGKEVKLTGKEIKELYSAIFDEYLSRKEKRVFDEYGITDIVEALSSDTEIDFGTAGFRIDGRVMNFIEAKNHLKRKLQERIKNDEVIRQGNLSQELLAKIELRSTSNGLDFTIPLSFPGNNKFSSLLTRIASKEILDVSLSGKNYVVAAAPGIFKVFDHKLREYVKRELRMYEVDTSGEETKIYAAEILVSPDFLTKFGFEIGDEIDLDTLLENIPQEALEAFGARTPHTGKSSSIAFVVAGLLPKNYSNHILVPGNIVQVTGMDFDFDKLFTYFYNLKVFTDENGNQIVSRTNAVYDIDELKNASDAALENTLLEIINGIQLDPKHHEEAVTPLNTQMYEGFINTYITDDYTSTDVRFESPLYDIQMVSRYQAAAKLVGIYANSYTGIAVLTSAAEDIQTRTEIGVGINASKHIRYKHTGENLVVNGEEIVSIPGKKSDMFLTRIVSTSPITNRPITYFLTKDISGAVDAGNNPYQNSWNENPDTANAKVFLESLGIDGNTVGLILNSEAVRDFANILGNYRAKGAYSAFMEALKNLGYNYTLSKTFLDDVIINAEGLSLPPISVQDLHLITAYRAGKLDALIKSLPETSQAQAVQTEEGVVEDFGIDFRTDLTNNVEQVEKANVRRAVATIYFGVKDNSKVESRVKKEGREYLFVDISSGLVPTNDIIDAVKQFISSTGAVSVNMIGDNLSKLPERSQESANNFMVPILEAIKDQVRVVVTRGESGIQEASALAAKQAGIKTNVFSTKDLSFTSQLGNKITESPEEFYKRFGATGLVEPAQRSDRYEFKSLEELDRKIDEIELNALKIFIGAYYAGKELSNDLQLLTPDKLDENTDLFIFLEYIQKLTARLNNTKPRLISLDSIQTILTGNRTLQSSYVRAIQNIVSAEQLTGNVFVSKAMLSAIDKMRNMTGKTYFGERSLKLIGRMLNYWMLTKEGSPISSWYNDETIKRMYFNDDPGANLGDKLDLIKKNAKLAKNKFVQRLDTITVKVSGIEFKVIVFPQTDETIPGEMDEIRKDFEDILNRPSMFYKNEEDRQALKQFAKDLIYNSFFSTAFVPGYGNYFNIIPESFFTKTQPGEKMSLVTFYSRNLQNAETNSAFFDEAIFDIIRSIGHTSPESFSSIIPRYTGKVNKTPIDMNNDIIQNEYKSMIESRLAKEIEVRKLKSEEAISDLRSKISKEVLIELQEWGMIEIDPNKFTEIEESKVEEFMDEERFTEHEDQIENFIRKDLPLFISRKTESKTFPVIVYIRVGENTYSPIQPLGMGKRFVELNLRNSATKKISNKSIFGEMGGKATGAKGIKSIPAQSIKYLERALNPKLEVENITNTLVSKNCKLNGL